MSNKFVKDFVEFARAFDKGTSESPVWNLKKDATLGDIFRAYREDRGLSRAKLARRTGISENSLAKYELAGREGGQYPPATKLAILCSELEIDPAIAMVNSLTPDEGGRWGRYFARYVIFDELPAIVMAGLEPGMKIDRADMMRHLLLELIELRAKTEDQQEDIDSLTKEVEALRAGNCFPDSQQENGSDRKDPSRPSQNPPAAVSAASDQPKEEDQT